MALEDEQTNTVVRIWWVYISIILRIQNRDTEFIDHVQQTN